MEEHDRKLSSGSGGNFLAEECDRSRSIVEIDLTSDDSFEMNQTKMTDVDAETTRSAFFCRLGNRAKKVHMDMLDCKGLADSDAGAKALVAPASVLKSSKDPNRGLYPRPSRKGSSAATSFVAASTLHSAMPTAQNAGFDTCSANSCQQSWTFECSPPKRQRSRKKLPPQSNSLDRYFTTSQASKSSRTVANMSSTPPKSSFEGKKRQLSLSPPSFMYSPVKRVEGTNLFTCSSNSAKNTTNSSAQQNAPVVSKQLFNSEEMSRPKKERKELESFAKKSDSDFVQSSSTSPDKVVKDKYGLLGQGHTLADDPEEDTSGIHIDSFPLEILENIFCRLPMLDLCLNVNRVCTRWRDFISSEKVSHSTLVRLKHSSTEILNQVVFGKSATIWKSHC